MGVQNTIRSYVYFPGAVNFITQQQMLLGSQKNSQRMIRKKFLLFFFILYICSSYTKSDSKSNEGKKLQVLNNCFYKENHLIIFEVCALSSNIMSTAVLFPVVVTLFQLVIIIFF